MQHPTPRSSLSILTAPGIVPVPPHIAPDQDRVVAAVAASDYLSNYGWLPWIVVALIGAAAGATEIVARYRDEPSRALTSKPAILYIAINAAASLIALVLIQQLRWTFSVGESQTDLIGLSQILVAGFGAMVVLRAAVFTIRGPGKEEMIGPVNVLQTILDACDRAVDRKRASARAESVARLMKDISFERASVELPMVSIALLQNLSEEDKTRLAGAIRDLSLKRNSVSNEGLCLSLGLVLLGVLGEDALQAAVAAVRSRIKAPDSFTPVIDFIHPTTITVAALNAVADVPIMLGGRNFYSEAKVLLDGQVQPTVVVNENRLTAQVPAAILSVGEHRVTAFSNDAFGGKESSPLPISVVASVEPNVDPPAEPNAGAVNVIALGNPAPMV